MNIRTRLTVQFTLLVSITLILFAATIYYFSSDHREDEFYSRMKEKALTTVKLFSNDVKEVDTTLLSIIDRNSTNLPAEKILIFDLNGHLLYSLGTRDRRVLSEPIRKAIIAEKELRISGEPDEELGLYYEGKQDKLLVYASAFDKYGLSKIKFLKYLLVIVVLVGILLTLILGLFFSNQALTPMAKVVNQVAKISFFIKE